MKREIEHFVYLGAFMKNILLEMIIHNSFTNKNLTWD